MHTADASSECNSFVERTVWDGDQVLYEIRARSNASQLRSELEDNETPFDAHYGRVVYTHALGIDQPIEIVRLDHNFDTGRSSEYRTRAGAGPTMP